MRPFAALRMTAGLHLEVNRSIERNADPLPGTTTKKQSKLSCHSLREFTVRSCRMRHGARTGTRYPKPMLIDSHCHLDDYEDLPAVLAAAREAGVGTLLAIGIGDGPETMHRALAMAREHGGDPNGPAIFATAGIHPQEAHRATPEALAKLAELAADPRCLAIGEIGLDYYHLDNPDPAVQQAAFVAQMAVAARAGKPITIHCRTSELAGAKVKDRFEHRDAWADLLALIADHWTPDGHAPGRAGIMHCFSGDAGQAEASLAAGFYLSFAGNLTYPKSIAIQGVAQAAPADRILVETDAPFLAPVPRRGERNQPALVTHTAAFLAALRGTTPEAIAVQTSENFHALFPSAAVGTNQDEGFGIQAGLNRA